MSKISTEQALQVMGTFMVNTDWSKVDFNKSGLQQAVITDPKGAGERFVAFLMNGASMQLPDGTKAPAPKLASKPSVLKPVNDNVQVAAVAAYDPSGFKTRQGLWVSSEFHSRVGSKAKPVENLGAITLSSFDLTKNAYDKAIKADPVMPANHVFTSESEFVAYLDQMVSKQSNGEEGDLLNNGYWNIFYVARCVVRVGWFSGVREWHVNSWCLDDVYWDAGYRVFSRN
ncbi:MAG: hypothetical protein JWL88_281 [Parcubacteria group bacterium]|nr:hypothetical protein [Parcubacteria group bacterium]